MKMGFTHMLWCPQVYHSPAVQRQFWTPEYTGEHRGVIGAYLAGCRTGWRTYPYGVWRPVVAQMPLSPTINWLANDHFVAVHLPAPAGQWSPALSSSNSPARTNNKPLTPSTHRENSIVTHMLG